MTRGASRLTIVALLLLATLGMVAQAGSVAHLHVDRATALHNAEHDLTLLAGLAAHALQVDAPPAVTVELVAPWLMPETPERPVAPVARSGDSRAPPSA
jgi:hypothetical protein